MPNKQPPMLGTLLKLLRTPKALLSQYTMVGKNNMVAIGRLSQTFGFASMTSSAMKYTKHPWILHWP